MLHLVHLDAQWPLGETLCRMYALILHLVPCTGIGILVCVSVEKYIAVLHPLLALKLLTPKFRSLMMAAVWICSLLANLPYYTTSKYREWEGGNSACFRGLLTDGFVSTRNMLIISFLVWYCIPLCIIAFLYTRIGFVLWHSAPLKKLTQMRTNSNETTTMTGIQKRSVASCRLSAITNNNGSATIVSEVTIKTPSKRSNSQPNNYSKITNNNLPPLILVNKSSPLPNTASESEGEEEDFGREEEGREEEEDKDEEEEEEESNGSHLEEDLDDDEEEEDAEHENGTKCRLALGNGSVGPAHLGQRNSAPSSSTVFVSTVESRKRIIRLLIAIVCSFAVLTLPNHIRLLYSAVYSEERICLGGFEVFTQPVTYLLLFLSSSCNPFLYAFMSQRFRSAIRDIFKCRRGHIRRKSTKTRTQNSDVLCAVNSGDGVALSDCSSLNRLNNNGNNNLLDQSKGEEINSIHGEKNFPWANQKGEEINWLKVKKLKNTERNASGGSGNSTTTASSVLYTTQHSNGSLQMAVVYRKCAC
uniref:G-protein coupled receptors family 1 profile domain-containing protein n=1 Tax=Meloidogyne incognita TaxID=6306 RepID=A0A914LAD2_MELIC